MREGAQPAGGVVATEIDQAESHQRLPSPARLTDPDIAACRGELRRGVGRMSAPQIFRTHSWMPRPGGAGGTSVQQTRRREGGKGAPVR